MNVYLWFTLIGFVLGNLFQIGIRPMREWAQRKLRESSEHWKCSNCDNPWSEVLHDGGDGERVCAECAEEYYDNPAAWVAMREDGISI